MRKTVYTAEILAVGSELTRGECLESNSSFLAKGLSPLGVQIRRITTIGDELSLMVKTIREAQKRSRLLILSGGLGPTHDDLTRKALALAFGRRLIFHPPLLHAIKEHFQKRGLPMPPLNRLQAYLPQGGYALSNPIGSAPGIYLKQGACEIFSLPGVPEELRRMFRHEVLPILCRRVPRQKPLVYRRVRTTGLQESVVAEKVADILRKEKNFTFGVYAHPGIVDITVTPRNNRPSSRKKIGQVIARIKKRLGPAVFGQDEETLEEVVFRLLGKRKKTVSVAESCTGGTVSSELTRFPGSSRQFNVGIVAYHNRIKQKILKVPAAVLAKEGAVSTVVAKAMAQAARRLGKTDLGLGITGILGPTGGTKKKPVGLVYMALATPRQTLCYEYRFQGDRAIIRRRATLTALELLRKELLH